MPKSTITFDLPEENDEFKLATSGSSYYCCLDDIRNEIRNKIKYADLTDEEDSVWREVQNMFVSVLEDRHVYLDEIA